MSNGYKSSTDSIVRKENINDLTSEGLIIRQEHFKKLLNVNNQGDKTYITFYSLQTLISKIKIYQTIMKSVVCYGCEIWTITKQNELLHKDQCWIIDGIPNKIILRSQFPQWWAGQVQRSPNNRLINMVWNQNPTGTTMNKVEK